MTTDADLTEQIARAKCGSPTDHEWRTWGEDDPGLRAITLQYAARLLPIIRKAERDAAREALDGLRSQELAMIPADADEDHPIRVEKQSLAWRIEMLIRNDCPEETP